MDQHHLSETAPLLKIGVLALCLSGALGAVAHAQESRGGGDRHGQGRHEIYFDERHHHAHYYPALGYSVPVLPADSIAVPFKEERLFFNAGVWYRLAGPAFVVIRPPEGVVVPVLPPGYTTVWAGNEPYYYANETYYIRSPSGYSVTAQPAAPLAEKPPSQNAQQTPSQPSSIWYYCASAKAYYPYVAECRDGWQAVPTKPY